MRNLVVCLDGTWDGAHSDSSLLTNIRFIANSCQRIPGNEEMPDQVVHYEDGIGVGSLTVDKYLMGAFGRGVLTQARRAWDFLRLNHRKDDKIYIFGFSRGAYAARQLASMVVHCGVSNTTYGNLEQDYREWLKNAGSAVVNPKQYVHFLGLFDCVPGNQFIPHAATRRRLDSPVLENGIRHFRHALAIDERRWSFRPLVFTKNSQQTFEQLKFPGYHRDVGGGGQSSLNLATIPMWWLMREAYGLGMGFSMLRCRTHHREGRSTFIGTRHPNPQKFCSDYSWTKWLKIRHVRSNDKEFSRLLDAPPVTQMRICPNCPLPMF